jgi:hypothetical protein
MRFQRRLIVYGEQRGGVQCPNQDITKNAYSLRCDKNRRRLVGLPLDASW